MHVPREIHWPEWSCPWVDAADSFVYIYFFMNAVTGHVSALSSIATIRPCWSPLAILIYESLNCFVLLQLPRVAGCLLPGAVCMWNLASRHQIKSRLNLASYLSSVVWGPIMSIPLFYYQFILLIRFLASVNHLKAAGFGGVMLIYTSWNCVLWCSVYQTWLARISQGLFFFR